MFAVTFLLIFWITHKFRKRQREIDIKVDEENITPADFAVMVKRIPKYLAGKSNLEEDLTYFFENMALSPKKFPDVKVEKVILSYKLEDYYKLEAERDKAKSLR